jgi:RNA polymerase sigma-70 factor, ECF subfamily
LPDQELTEQLLNADGRAFQQLYEKYGPAVYRVCFRFLNHQTEAEDAVQEVFLKAFHSLSRFRGQAQISTWLYRIAVNHCLNLQRKKKALSWLSLEFLNDRQLISAASDDNPVENLEKKETQGLIEQAIAALPERQRMAFILCRYELKSYQEIAEIMNCSLAAVESCLHHAKKNLSLVLKNLLKN